MRSIIYVSAVMVLAVLLVPAVAAADASGSPVRLNVLLVTIDTLRADRVGCYGSAVPTPNIDELARRGALFTRAFAHTPLTLPSHASILIGTTPLDHGVHDNINFIVRPEHTTLAELLKANGYKTAAIVSASPLDSRFGLAQGFDLYDDTFMAPGTPKTSPAEQKAEVAVGKALRWLRGMRSEPWFLWIHVWDPHSDYDPPEPFRTQYKDRPYDGEVAYTDFALGRLFRALEENRMSERTLIVLTADHGEGLGDHGERTHGFIAHNATIHVPLIITAPGLQAVRSPAPVSHSDIVPTILDILAIKPPSGLQGQSLRPALSAKPLPPRKIYFECMSPYYELGWAPLQGFIDGNLKFVGSPVPEVYDLAVDFDEMNNIAAKVQTAAYESTLARLMADLTPAQALDARAKPSPELREKLQSLGYLARSNKSLRTSFTADDDPKTLLPLLNKITDAYDLKSQGRLEEAVRRLEGIIKEPRTLDTAYVHLADLYKESGKPARALDVLAAGWLRFPSSYELLTTYVADLVSAARWKDVVRVVGDAPSLLQMDHDGIIWFLQGLAYQKLEDTPRSVAAFERAVAADEEFLAALFNLGAAHLSLYFQTGAPVHCQQAIPILRRAIGLDSKNAESHVLLGRAYLEAGQTDRAINSLETARRLAPNLAHVEYQLGMAFWRKGDYSRAYSYLIAFKGKVYQTLTASERADLDSLIENCAALIR